MPSRQPFTLLCQQLARKPGAGRADLHLHTTCSDGNYTPAEVIDLARRCGLSALAITDHDTLAGVEPARDAAGGAVEVVSGVEITTEFRGRELHLLGYFVDIHDHALNDALAGIRRDRVERFHAMVERLRGLGVSVTIEAAGSAPESLGRRYLAELLVRQGKAGSVREVFQRWLGDRGRAAVPKWRLPVAEAIRLVRAAGGVAAWAHPFYDGAEPALGELAALGLGAVEVEYPDLRLTLRQQLRAWARQLGLAVTGGSDCHGPGRRTVGACTISDEELERLRQLRGNSCSVPCTTSSSKG
ncbi:MAG: PHP domain-containing protein [Gemmataceae bacterium]